MKTAKDVLKSIKDNDVKYVDLRFTDPRGKWQHVTFDIGMIDEEIFAEGTIFDGSSTSQVMTMVVSAKNGSIVAVTGSGIRHMSDSLIAFQPAIEEPSNI